MAHLFKNTWGFFFPYHLTTQSQASLAELLFCNLHAILSSPALPEVLLCELPAVVKKLKHCFSSPKFRKVNIVFVRWLIRNLTKGKPQSIGTVGCSVRNTPVTTLRYSSFQKTICKALVYNNFLELSSLLLINIFKRNLFLSFIICISLCVL